MGSLDLGGASTQIAFMAPLDARGADLIQISLYGYEYNVYTHSFLCYGKNEAEKKVLAELVKVTFSDPVITLHLNVNCCWGNAAIQPSAKVCINHRTKIKEDKELYVIVRHLVC